VTATPARRTRLLRIALLVATFVVPAIVVKVYGLEEYVDVEQVRAWVAQAGPFGFAVFLAVFVVGELMHIPGMVFVAAASAAYGEWIGFAAAYLGGLASVSVGFAVARGIGGQPLVELRWAWARRALAHLEDRPVLTVALLRTFLWMLPALNYAFGVSPIRFRDHLLGSALGLLLPIGVAVFFFEWLFA
jgi:uncharacterized membrane protein YdjX (TVP38/TMEM64 family)